MRSKWMMGVWIFIGLLVGMLCWQRYRQYVVVGGARPGVDALFGAEEQN